MLRLEEIRRRPAGPERRIPKILNTFQEDEIMNIKILTASVISALVMGSAVSALAADPVVETGDHAVLVGEGTISQQGKMAKVRKSLLAGDNTYSFSTKEVTRRIVVMGEENDLKASNLKSTRDIVLIGNGNQVDLENLPSSYNITMLGTENKITDPERRYINDAVIIGTQNTTKGSTSVAIGRVVSSANNAVAIGSWTETDSNGVAIGYHASAYASGKKTGGSVALGVSATAGAEDSISQGNRSQVLKDAESGIAIGAFTEVGEAGGVALGKGSKVKAGSGSQAGYNFKTEAQYEEGAPAYAKETTGSFSVGDAEENVYRRITNVAAGKDDVDAVNVGQLKDAVSAVNSRMDKKDGELQEAINGVDTKVDGLDTRMGAAETKAANLEKGLGDLDTKVDNGFSNVNNTVAGLADSMTEMGQNLKHDIEDVRSYSKAGIANAAALSALHMQPTDGTDKMQILAGIGTHGGKQSVALGAGYRINDNTVMTMGVAMGSGSTYTGNMGFSWSFGGGKPSAARKEAGKVAQLESQVNELQQQVRYLQAMVQQLAAK